MTNINEVKLFEFFDETLNASSSKLLNMDNDELGYTVFETLSSSYLVFLQNETLNILIDKWIITDEISEKCTVLRSKLQEIENSKLWDIEFIKTDSKWLNVMRLSDEIKKMIIDIWGENYFERIKESVC